MLIDMQKQYAQIFQCTMYRYQIESNREKSHHVEIRYLVLGIVHIVYVVMYLRMNEKNCIAYF